MTNSIINEWTNVLSSERNEIVFENRNKSYGAYFIRREYTSTLIIALLSTVSAILLLAVIVPGMFDVIKPAVEKFKNTELTEIFNMTPPPVTPPVELPRVLPTPVTPPTQANQLAPPVVVDQPVTTDPIKIQDDPAPATGNVGAKSDVDGTPGIPNPTPPGNIEPPTEPLLVPEVMPEFQNGGNALNVYLSKEIKYPETERANTISGKVYISFVIDKDGNISDVKEHRGIMGGTGLTKEAMRVIKNMPKWKPGKQHGMAVPVRLIIPVNFKLN